MIFQVTTTKQDRKSGLVKWSRDQASTQYAGPGSIPQLKCCSIFVDFQIPQTLRTFYCFQQMIENMKLFPIKVEVLKYPLIQSLIPAHHGLLRKITLKTGLPLSKFHFNQGHGFESQTFLVFFKPFQSFKKLKNSFCYLILTQTIP